MKEAKSVNAILNIAIEREDESYAFYSDVAKQVHDKAVKDAFQQLAKDELGHKEFIKKCLKDPDLLKNIPTTQDYKLAEATDAQTLSVSMKPKDAIALAMKKEQGAAEFYSKLAAAAVDPKYRQTFLGLAKMEVGHKARLESIFVDIGYPEVW